jgi:hypothetical protein
MISILNTLYSTVVRKGAAFSAAINGLFAILEARSTYFENEKGSKTSVKELEDADLLDKASIILTPTGYSKDVIHNVKPSSTTFGDMTLVKNGTSTRVDENGFIAFNTTDIPRIDYSTGTGAILCELSSSNNVLYSEDASQTSTWPVQSNVTISAVITAAPTGNIGTVYTLERTGPGAYGLGQPISFTHSSGRSLGLSMWVRRRSGSGDTGELSFGKGSGLVTYVNTYNVGSDWQRVTWASTGGTTASYIEVRGEVGQVFEVWGAQAESGDYGKNGRVTSYIPTSGTIGNRNRDNYANGGDATLIGQTEGVFYFEGASLTDYQSGRAMALSDGGAANRVVLFFDYAEAKIRTLVRDGNNNQAILIQPIADQKSFNKIAVKYKSGDIALWINGTEVQTSTTALSFTSPLNELAFDQGNGSVHMDGLIKQVAVFKEALSDAELTALTT